MTRWDWNPSEVVLMDLETQSAVNLREDGSRAYLSDPSTRLMSAVFLLQGGHIIVWVPEGRTGSEWYADPAKLWPAGYATDRYTLTTWSGSEPPPEVRAAIARGATFAAHNAAGFDREAWERLVGGPQPRWTDTLPCARAAGLPGSLDALGLRLLGRGKEPNRALKMLYTAKRGPDGRAIYVPGSAALWVEMLRYNVGDVLLLDRVYSAVADYGEPDVLDAHFAIEDRGILIDRPLLSTLRELWSELQGTAADQVAEWTEGIVNEGNIRSVPQVKAWLARQGLHVESLNRKALERLYADPLEFFGEIPEGVDVGKVIEVLRARQTATRISTGKIDRLVSATAGSPDGRARGILVYWGAHTGRWSGRGFQPHNLAKGVKDLDVEECLTRAAAGTLTLDYLRAAVAECKPVAGLAPTVDDALTTLLRPALVASPGHTFAIVDYASVEARGIAWIAGQDDLLDVFRTGGDPYCLMASRIFGREVTKADKREREIGKITVLGCIAEGTPVLTDRGWVPIESVALTDRVWDGTEWVSHDGVIDKGAKECVNVCGVWLTPDHEVLTDDGWREAWLHEGNTRPPLRGTFAETGRFTWSRGDLGEGSSASGAVADAGSWVASSQITGRGEGREGAIAAPNGKPRPLWRSTLPSVPIQTTGNGCSTASARLSDAVRTRRTVSGNITGPGGFRFIPNGLTIEGRSWRISSPSPDGTTHVLRSTASTTIEGTSPETSDSLHGLSSARTVVRTYDIANAGVRHTFQAGPLLVHNCGYGMGWRNYDLFCQMQRIDLGAAGTSAQACVDAYRDAFPRIAGERKGRGRSGGIWKDLQRAAERAIQSRGRSSYSAGRCRFALQSGHLEIELPSGRVLTYRHARIEKRRPGWAVLQPNAPEVDTIVYTHPHGYDGTLYGGLIAENVVQAICRDLLATALVRCEDSPVATVLHVHDEIVGEVPLARAAEGLEFLARTMSEGPEWADGFPIGVEGFTSPRYVKSPFNDSYLAEGLNGSIHITRKQ